MKQHQIVEGTTILFETDDLTEAEEMLCYFLNHDHDCYLESYYDEKKKTS